MRDERMPSTHVAAEAAPTRAKVRRRMTRMALNLSSNRHFRSERHCERSAAIQS